MEIALFLIFASLVLFSAIMVINSKNPVHSVLFLILVFCNVSALLILLKAEFLAFIFLIVYVGAIAVLFLFVVMMLNIHIAEFKEHMSRYLPIGGFIGFIFLIETYLIINHDLASLDMLVNTQYDTLLTSYIELTQNLQLTFPWFKTLNQVSNIEIIGLIMYTYYFYLFLLSSLILLVAMIAAIVMTIYRNRFVYKQNIAHQMLRGFENVLYFTSSKN